uniref:Secreted protein n=1 Tax=Thraustotheca clavata TaxID=74557 RepID=A0A0A7CM73_9STRA|nr:secreted protein [Thraustotheca clavata]
MRLSSFVSYLSIVATVVYGDCAHFDENTDYPGNDIGSTKQAKAENCCHDCAAFNGCKAFVWVPRDGGVCLLKSNTSGKYPSNGARASTIVRSVPPLSGSCPVTEADTDYPGNDLGRTQRSSIDLCCNDCEATPNCARFVYANGDCILKSAGGSPAKYTGATAASFNPKKQTQAPAPVSSNATCSAFDENTDYPGNDIGTASQPKADDCCADCAAFPGCKAFVWVPRDGGVCLLKSASSGKWPSTGARASTIVAPTPSLTGSCPVTEPNTDYPGNDLGRTQRSSIDLCCNDCEATPNCARFVYANGDCILKSAGGSPTKYNGATAASYVPKVVTPTPAPVANTCSPIDEDTDYMGNDIGTTSRSTAEGCCADCEANPSCKAYVWVFRDGGVCLLKSAKGQRASYKGARASTVISRFPSPPPMVGCLPIQEDTDFPGNDLTTTFRSAAEFCCDDCTKTPGCNAFVWSGSGICHLKTASSSPVKSIGNRASVIPRSTNAVCSKFEDDVDYPGNDIGQTYRVKPEECCNDCADNRDCTAYVWSSDYGGICYLKSAKSDPYPVKGAKAGTFQRKNPDQPSNPPAPAPSNVVAGSFGTYPSPTIAFNSIPNTQWIAKTEDLVIGGIDIMKPFPLPSPEEMIKAHDAKPKPLLEATTNTYYFALIQSIGECAMMSSSSGYSLFTYVTSTKICVVHDFGSPSTSTFAMNKQQAPIALQQQIPMDFSLGKNTSVSSQQDCQKSCNQIANCAATTFSGTTCTYFGPAKSQDGVSAGWVIDPIVWNEKPNSMQYITMTMRSINLSGYSTQNGNAKTVDDCANAALQKKTQLFSFDTSKKVCTLASLPIKASMTLQLYNYPSAPAVFTNFDLASGTTQQTMSNTASASECQKLCIPSSSGCMGSVFNTQSKQCILHIPDYSATTTIGWIIPETLTSVVKNPTAVNFYVNAHQDDHELFMASNLYDSFSKSTTKIVMIYMSAGDAGATNGWYQAREEGTLASAQSFVKLFGLYSPLRKTETITMLKHQITKVTMGNAIHYFLRLSEDGMTNLPSKSASPMDRPTEKYANVNELQSVVIALMKAEAKGIGNAVVNSQQFKDPDHVLHAMAGQIVYDGVNGDSTLKKCMTQNYFWGYQRWLDTVNMQDPSLSTQRQIWWALNRAVVKLYPSNSPWYDHCEALGRQYLALNQAGTGTC